MAGEVRPQKTSGSKLLTDGRATITHPHNFLQYIKLRGTIRLPIYWLTDHCSLFVSNSSLAVRVGLETCKLDKKQRGRELTPNHFLLADVAG